MWQVYIIKSKRVKWYYVGSTNRLKIRFEEHNNGKVKSTKPYKPFNLVHEANFNSEIDARSYERKLKKCRKEKEELIKKIESQRIACLRRQV